MFSPTPEIIYLKADSTVEEKNQLLQYLLQTGDANQLRMLQLSCNTLTLTDLDFICRIVERSKQLVYLDLSHCDLGKTHTNRIEKLAKVVKDHPTLLSLIFSGNPLDFQGLAHLISTMLNGRLLQLDFAFCDAADKEIGDFLIDHLKDDRCRVIAFGIAATPLTQREDHPYPTQLQAIHLELQANQKKLLQDTQYLQQINIPDSVVQCLESRVTFSTTPHSQAAAFEVYPLIELKKRQQGSSMVLSKTVAPVLRFSSLGIPRNNAKNSENTMDTKRKHTIS